MSDHADSGEYGLHTNWENCEGGLCCDEALAIMEALVAERDEAREKNAKLSALIVEQESDYRNRKKAAERDLVVQHQRLLDLDETLTAELQAWKVRATEWEKRARPAEAEVARLREALHPDVLAERRHQDTVWGLQEHSDPIWLAILTEEVGEAAEGILHETFNDATGETRAEVVQIAAVALAWLQCIDARAALGEDA